MKLNDEHTEKEEAALAFDHLKQLEGELERLHRQLAERTDYESDEYRQIIQRSTDVQGVVAVRATTISRLKPKRHCWLDQPVGFRRPTHEFSGGCECVSSCQDPAALADLLLLDEPTTTSILSRSSG
jgi:ATP-binding cassette subfamily F protein 3